MMCAVPNRKKWAGLQAPHQVTVEWVRALGYCTDATVASERAHTPDTSSALEIREGGEHGCPLDTQLAELSQGRRLG